MSQKSYDGKPTLYLVPTPIGNLGDMTYRGVETLKNSEVIFSEDTRESKKLLDYYDIKKKLIACHKFNEDDVYLKVLDYLNNGFDVSIITDRGTPSISDPGYVSVFKVIQNGYNVVCLPGATAFTPAIVNSGLNPNKFLFYGFLDSKKSIARKELIDLKEIKQTLIFYEAPHRIDETLNLMLDVLGDRNIALVREISKLHEEIIRNKISEILKVASTIKGEIVIVVEGYKEEDKDDNNYGEIINNLIAKGYSKRDAIKETAERYNVSKNKLYNMYKEV